TRPTRPSLHSVISRLPAGDPGLLPFTAEYLPAIGRANSLPRSCTDPGGQQADTAVGQAGDHDAAVQGLETTLITHMRNGIRLDAAGVDHAAVPVLPKIGVGARTGAGIGVVRIAVGLVEQRAVPPGVAVRTGRVVGRGQRRGRGTVLPVAVGCVPPPAGP